MAVYVCIYERLAMRSVQSNEYKGKVFTGTHQTASHVAVIKHHYVYCTHSIDLETENKLITMWGVSDFRLRYIKLVIRERSETNTMKMMRSI